MYILQRLQMSVTAGRGAPGSGQVTKGNTLKRYNMISLAKKDGASIYVYDENGNIMFTRSGFNLELVGFTGTTVSIRDGGSIYVFDEKGNIKFTKPV